MGVLLTVLLAVLVPIVEECGLHMLDGNQ